MLVSYFIRGVQNWQEAPFYVLGLEVDFDSALDFVFDSGFFLSDLASAVEPESDLSFGLEPVCLEE